MNLNEMLKQQKKRRLKKTSFKSKTPSLEEYTENPDAKRPYTQIPKNDLPLTQSATQKSLSATQSATQKSLSATQSATQKSLSATQSATQKIPTPECKKGRPEKDKYDLSSMVGNELKIINEIYSECVKQQSLETDFLEKKAFSKRIDVKIGSIRTSCIRLREKKILDDFIATKGRGSAWKFIISKHVYDQISLKNAHKLACISDTKNSSSSTTTTTILLPEAWQKIDYQELQKVLHQHGETFGAVQLKALYKEIGSTFNIGPQNCTRN